MTCARSLLALVLLLACLLPSLDGRDAPYVKRVRSQRSLLSQLQGHEGTDRAGSDLLEQPALLRKGATAKHCAQLCLDTEGCKAWSYDPSGGAFTCSSPHPAPTSTPHCYLKHSHATVAAHPCRTSGTPYATLATPAFPKLPASAVQPTGWLATQLRLQQSGLAGHLQLFWADVSDSSFIGGQHDTPEHNHERFLYWLNGALPMAYFNNDTQLITQVANFTNYLITHQRADGWIGPSENYDPWPRMLALYIFSQYSEFNSSDARVVPAMYSYLRFLWKQYSDPKYNPMDYMWTYVRIEDMQVRHAAATHSHAQPYALYSSPLVLPCLSRADQHRMALRQPPLGPSPVPARPQRDAVQHVMGLEGLLSQQTAHRRHRSAHTTQQPFSHCLSRPAVL